MPCSRPRQLVSSSSVSSEEGQRAATAIADRDDVDYHGRACRGAHRLPLRSNTTCSVSIRISRSRNRLLFLT